MKPNIKGLRHDHVDGSMAVKDVIVELYDMAGMTFPFTTEDEWLAFMRDSKQDIVKRFDTVTSVLQSAEALEFLGYAYGKRRAAEGYIYAEAKFAPQYHVSGGLSMRAVVNAVRRGFARAEHVFGIRIMPVICIGREASMEKGMEIASLALDYDGEVALDLVCDEAGHPPEKYLKAYRLTFGSKVRRHCHAGEWVAPDPIETHDHRLLANICTAVFELRCESIGHAIPLGRNDGLTRYIAGEGIQVTGCPLSNLASGWINNLRDLEIVKMLDVGVRYTLNADDDLFLPVMDEVITQCDKAYCFTDAECRKLELNAVRD